MTAREPSRLLVLDLDGTLCLGDAPVRAYARAVADLLPPREGSDLIAGVEVFLAGSGDSDAADGYQAVAAAALGAGLPLTALGDAYGASRDLDAWIDAVRAPTGMHDVLGEAIAVGVLPALVTNAGGGIPRLLAALGLADVVTTIVSDAGKPERMPEHLERLLAGLTAGPVDVARRLAGLGDIWVNDLAEIARRGGTTFLIDRHRLGHGAPTASAPEPEGLLDALRDWIASDV